MGGDHRPARRRPWAVPALGLLVLALIVVAAGCGGDGGSAKLVVDGQQVPARRLDEAVAGLCQARAAAGGDPTRARASFYDRSHETLHVIARALEPVDRAQAARLLESKEAVEAGLAAPQPGGDLAGDLDRLLDVTRASLDRLGVEVPPCPD